VYILVPNITTKSNKFILYCVCYVIRVTQIEDARTVVPTYEYTLTQHNTTQPQHSTEHSRNLATVRRSSYR
jgi:hypothetical protein